MNNMTNKIETKQSTCDMGCVSVLCGTNIISYSNIGGDTYYHDITVDLVNGNNFGIGKKDIEFVSSAIFDNAKVLSYDCIRLQHITEQDVLFTLTGRFGIYRGYNHTYFVKWSN